MHLDRSEVQERLAAVSARTADWATMQAKEARIEAARAAFAGNLPEARQAAAAAHAYADMAGLEAARATEHADAARMARALSAQPPTTEGSPAAIVASVQAAEAARADTAAVPSGADGSAAEAAESAHEAAGQAARADRLVNALRDTAASVDRRAPLEALISRVNPIAGELNCGACAVAVESTLSGRPAVADATGPTDSSTIAGRYGRSWQDSSVAEINASLAGHVGAGGVVEIWDGRQGHLLNAANIGGRVVWLDGQNGAIGSAAEVLRASNWDTAPKVSIRWLPTTP